MTDRHRLPNRREQFTQTILAGGVPYEASVGFDDKGEIRELFLSGARAGSEMDAILADTSVIVSVALQNGVSASDLARSLARKPAWPDAPADTPCHAEPASIIGAALDLLVHYETEEWRR